MDPDHCPRSGLQEDVLVLPGPIVTMVGSGPYLAIFYHTGCPFAESQNQSYKLVDTSRRSLMAAGSLCITPKSLLTWAGFSDLGMLCIMDSEGVVAGLVKVGCAVSKNSSSKHAVTWLMGCPCPPAELRLGLVPLPGHEQAPPEQAGLAVARLRLERRPHVHAAQGAQALLACGFECRGL